MAVGCETDLRAVRDGLIGGCFCKGTWCDLFEVHNVTEYDERGSKSKKVEGVTVRVSQSESISCDMA